MRDEKVLENIEKAFKKGQLDDKKIVKLADLNEREAVALALSLLTSADEKKVADLIQARSAEGVTALCWKADLTMRTAHAVQRAFNIPHAEMLLPRGGFAYPLSDEKMQWQLDYFGIEPKA